MPQASVSRADLISFFAEIRSSNGFYHNHKEALAWASEALYLAGALQVALSRRHGAVLALAIVLITVVLLAYARRQFNLRVYAADLDWAVQRLAAQAAAGQLDNLRPADLMPKPPEQATSSRLAVSPKLLPAAVWRLAFPPRYQPETINKDVYPPVVIRELELLQLTRKEARQRAVELENASYLLVAAVGVATVLLEVVR